MKLGLDLGFRIWKIVVGVVVKSWDLESGFGKIRIRKIGSGFRPKCGGESSS